MEMPLITGMQKIVLYKTKARFYIVGSNSTETRFRILKIDRTEPRDLLIHDDKIEYTLGEVKGLLKTLDLGNKIKGLTSRAGLSRTVSAFGIAGFVKFLEGYYIILITKRKKVALIGHNTIYKIEDTCMLYIPNDDARVVHPEESRYVKIFNNFDLKSNVYFSYSYDLTRTLQYNMAPNCDISCNDDFEESQTLNPEDLIDPLLAKSSTNDDEVEDADKIVTDSQDLEGQVVEFSDMSDKMKKQNTKRSTDYMYGIRNKPSKTFVWNMHLLNGFKDTAHIDWILYLTHGFIGQMNINVFGKSVFLTLIARRSSRFAGTRFLKRGGNCHGDVANHVETEQIVQDSSVLSLTGTRISSFVQNRGSIPLYWSQDIAKMMPKPSIIIDQSDPFCYAAGKHFSELIQRYGAPLIVLNLVKKKESSRKHESLLRNAFIETIHYLNQFLPDEHAIQHIGFDMAHIKKSKTVDVFDKLKDIAEYCVHKTGFFYNRPLLYCHKVKQQKEEGANHCDTDIYYQNGAVRTNCVDCLDRTNTAQFAIGKTALGQQLYAFGFVDSSSLDFDTDCVKMLEELYEDMGDTLAVQYGGSQLVHRIETYRKNAPWTTHSRDIMHTLSRYYSNAFSDAEKQHAINVFLGIYKPYEHKKSIWELPTDFYLHNSLMEDQDNTFQRETSYTSWLHPDVVECLPKPYDQEGKGTKDEPTIIKTRNGEKVDIFREYYKPYELTSLEDLFTRNIPCKQYGPRLGEDRHYKSPFVPIKTLRSRDSSDKLSVNRNPNVSGKTSTDSLMSSWSSDNVDADTDSSSDDSKIDGNISISDSSNSDHDTEVEPREYVSFQDLFPTMKEVYGTEIRSPSKCSDTMYKKYVQINRNATRPLDVKNGKSTTLIRQSAFTCDSSFHVTPPTLSRQSKELYNKYVTIANNGPMEPSEQSMSIYKKYVKTL